MFPFSIRYASIADGFYFADFSTWFTHNFHHQSRPQPDPVYGKILVLIIPGLVSGPGWCIWNLERVRAWHYSRCFVPCFRLITSIWFLHNFLISMRAIRAIKDRPIHAGITRYGSPPGKRRVISNAPQPNVPASISSLSHSCRRRGSFSCLNPLV